MNILSKSITWRLLLPGPLVIVALIVGAVFLVPNLTEKNARESAEANAAAIVDQFKTIRGYYTQNVIKKVLANGGVSPSPTHAREANGIPLPATFIHDMSERLADSDTTISLYSAFPFPLRQNRALDPFQQEAWAFLSANPDSTFSRRATRGGKEVVRVAIADRMVADACVSCHNGHPETPKADWAIGDVRGVLEVTTSIDEALAAGEELGELIIFGLLGGCALVVLVLLLMTRGVTGPLRSMTDAMRALADGDTTVDVPSQSRRDEVGAMAAAVQVFKDNAIRMNALEQEAAEKDTALREAQRKERAEIADGFERSVGDVVETLAASASQMESAASAMTATVQATTEHSDVVAGAAEGASRNVQMVASAAEQLSASIGEIARQVAESGGVANRAVEEAKRTNERVGSLAQASQRIGEVLSLISDIADQTNLLALNATIEAARAGEAGKGFAVVASEVKTLATQTAKATEEISSQIGGIQNATKEAVEAIDGIGETIATISEIATAIAGAVEQQRAATGEISANIHEVTTGTREVSQAIGHVHASAGDADRSATEVQENAGVLASQTETLRHEVERFLGHIRAA